MNTKIRYVIPLKQESKRFPNKLIANLGRHQLWRWAMLYCVEWKLPLNITVNGSISYFGLPEAQSWVSNTVWDGDFMNATLSGMEKGDDWVIFVNPCVPFLHDHEKLEARIKEQTEADIICTIRRPTIQPMSLVRPSEPWPWTVNPGDTEDNHDIWQIDFMFVALRVEWMLGMVDENLYTKWTSGVIDFCKVEGPYVDINYPEDLTIAESMIRY